MKTNNIQGDLTFVSAKKEAPHMCPDSCESDGAAVWIEIRQMRYSHFRQDGLRALTVGLLNTQLRMCLNWPLFHTMTDLSDDVLVKRLAYFTDHTYRDHSPHRFNV